MAISLTPFAPDPGYEHTAGFYPKGRPQGEMLLIIIILPHAVWEGERGGKEGDRVRERGRVDKEKGRERGRERGGKRGTETEFVCVLVFGSSPLMQHPL